MKNLSLAFFFFFFLPHIFSGFNFISSDSTLQLKGPSSKLILQAPMEKFNGTLSILEKSQTSIEQSTTSDTIDFQEGTLRTGWETTSFSGKISPGTVDKIILSGNSKLNLSESISETIEVTGTGNAIVGAAKLLEPINLTDSSTELDIAFPCRMNKNINLNGGKLRLLSDLDLKDEIKIAGSGVVDVNNVTLRLSEHSSSPWDGDLIFDNAQDVELRRNSSLTGRWRFRGSNSVSALRGFGSILDISGGGEIQVETNHTLELNGVHIKGLGSGKGFFDIHTGGKILFSNCTIELDGSYNHTNGELIFHGDNCKIIYRNQEKFNVVGSSASFTVDGVVLLFDAMTAGASGSSPVATSSGGTLSILNNGVIRNSVAAGSQSETNVEIDSGSGENESGTHLDLTSDASISFLNSAPASPKAMTFNGRGNLMRFGDGSNKPFVVQENVTLLIKDTILENFDLEKIDLRGSGSSKGKIEFGDGSKIKIKKDLVIREQIKIKGDAEIDSQGSRIELEGPEKLTVEAGKKLKVKNTKFILKNFDSIKALDDTSTLQFQDTELLMTQTGVTIDKGSIEVEGDLVVSAQDQTTPTSQVQLNFTSKGSLKINSKSRLKIARNSVFKYSPDISSDSGNSYLEKRHILMTDPSSKISLKDSTFETGPTGLALDYGQLIVSGKSKFKIESGQGKELEIGSALDLRIDPGADLRVDGVIKYVSTNFS